MTAAHGRGSGCANPMHSRTSAGYAARRPARDPCPRLSAAAARRQDDRGTRATGRTRDRTRRQYFQGVSSAGALCFMRPASLRLRISAVKRTAGSFLVESDSIPLISANAVSLLIYPIIEMNDEIHWQVGFSAI